MVDREAFDKILSGVYRDNPQWWPYGLKRAQFDESFAVRDPKSGAYCGFTGWQFRHDDAGKPVGYYAVGILPEFRRQGLAKRALQEMFTQHKPKHVNTIKAFIVPGNTPSCELARQLGVPVQHKSASLRTSLAGTTFQQMVPALQLPDGLHAATIKHANLWQRLAQQAGRAWGGAKAGIKHPATALTGASGGAALGYDAVQRSMDDKPFLSADHLRERVTQGLFNTMILASAGGIGRGMASQKAIPALTAASKAPTIARAALIAAQNARAKFLGGASGMLVAGTGGMPAKDLMMGNRYTGSDLVKTTEEMAKAMQEMKAQPAPNWFAENPVKSTIGAILAAAGIAGGSALLGRSNHAPQTQQDSKGRIKVTLPTKRPGDIETQLDMPVEQIELSNALMSKVRRDVRKRLRGESEERTVRKPLSPEERVRRANLLNSYHNRSLLA